MRLHPGRVALASAFFVAYGIFALPFALALLLPWWSDKLVRKIVRIFYKSFVQLSAWTKLYKIKVEGDVNIRGKIIVANHISLIDICVLIAKLPDSTVIAKAALRRNPFLMMVVKRAFIINDEGIDIVVSKMKYALRQGVNVIIFPQGTRGGIKFNRGAARLALATRTNLQCIRLDYEPPILTKNQPWWDVGNREIMIKFTNKGEIPIQGEFNYHNAVKITELIKEKLK